MINRNGNGGCHPCHRQSQRVGEVVGGDERKDARHNQGGR